MFGFDSATKKLKQLEQDRLIMHSLVEKIDSVYSTAENGALCLYIYAKPAEDGSNNVVIRQICAKHGIKLKKHLSHLDGVERPVLYIKMTDISELSPVQRDFLFGNPVYTKRPAREVIAGAVKNMFGKQK